MKKLKIGNKVKTLKNSWCKTGLLGTIVSINGPHTVGVDFGKNVNGHDLNHYCEYGNGWWLNHDDFKVVNDYIQKTKDYS